MEFKELMEGFGKRVGLPELAPDHDGSFQLGVDDMELVFLESAPTNEVVVWGVVGKVPTEGRDQLFALMMEAMFLGKGTDGAVFSIDAANQAIVLHRCDSLQVLDVDCYLTVIEGFVNLLAQWQRLVEEFRGEGEVVAPQEMVELEVTQMQGATGGGFMSV